MAKESGIVFDTFNIIFIRLNNHLFVFNARVEVTDINVKWKSFPTHNEIPVASDPFDPEGVVGFEFHRVVTKNIVSINFSRIGERNSPLSQQIRR